MERSNEGKPAGSKDISVAICTYNRDKFIGNALESLRKQTLSPDRFEILVVDNVSTDRTAEIAKAFIAAHPELEIRYVFEERKGVSFARNRAAQEAATPIVTYIDDDAEAEPDYLETILDFMQAHPDAVGIGGKVIPKYSESTEPAWISRYLYGFVGKVDFGDKPKLYKGAMKYPLGCNMAYKTDVVKQIGGFNNHLTFRSDDKYLYHEIAKVSKVIWYLPTAVVRHNVDKHRLQLDYFRKLYQKTGNEEKVRLRHEQGWPGIILKFVEYVCKVAAGLVFYGWYALGGKGLKGKYIFLSQWFTLKGFLRKEVFVR